MAMYSGFNHDIFMSFCGCKTHAVACVILGSDFGLNLDPEDIFFFIIVFVIKF